MSILQIFASSLIAAEAKSFILAEFDFKSLLTLDTVKAKSFAIQWVSSYATDAFIQRILPMLPLSTQQLAVSQQWSYLFRSLATGVLFAAINAAVSMSMAPKSLLYNLVIGMGAEAVSEKVTEIVAGQSLSTLGTVRKLPEVNTGSWASMLSPSQLLSGGAVPVARY